MHMRLLTAIFTLATAAGSRIAVVTGATRGIGRGIAIELGRKGHTVYALGRSSRGQQTTERAVAAGLDLTVESAAEAITEAGGTGHGIACNLNDDSDIEVEVAALRCSRGDQFGRSYIAFESTFTIEDPPRNLASPGTGRGVII